MQSDNAAIVWVRRIFAIMTRSLIMLLLVVSTIWLVRGFEARGKPKLEIWHTQTLENEYHARDYPGGITFEQYQQIELRLITELDEKIYQQLDAGNKGGFNRYDKTSQVFAGPVQQKWNRSFEMDVANPAGGILLVHGASDSPYSVRALSEEFNRQGFYVLALRIPGNGTIPSGLMHASLDDWVSVTRMGVDHVREQAGHDVPIYLGGYSVGAALILDYTLDALTDASLTVPDRLFLYSPAIGITKFARFSGLDVALSAIPFFEKFGWVSVQPEYDPFKYNSFAKNAGHITYRLTENIRRKIERSRESEEWQTFPPIISFQSLVDSTVHTGTLVTELYQYLPNNGSELVLFDINRADDFKHFIVEREHAMPDQLRKGYTTNFDFTLIENKSADTTMVQARTRAAGSETFSVKDLQGRWPTGVYSLSHVAIPFKDSDPWYGDGTAVDGEQALTIGAVAPRGEQGLLTVPMAQLMRLRHNPFFDYLSQRTSRFCSDCQRVQ